MAKGKLILICQSGGEFLKNPDGTLKYEGGEAQAVNVDSETVFDNIKLKLAEICNLEYGSVSMKYFLPKNTRTLISLSNDRDLKRMLDFHGGSVTADVFVTGKEGFNRDALIRDTGIKVAESANPAAIPAPAAAIPTPAAATPARAAATPLVDAKDDSPATTRVTRKKAIPAPTRRRKTSARKKAIPAARKRATRSTSKSVIEDEAPDNSPTTDTMVSNDSSSDDTDDPDVAITSRNLSSKGAAPSPVELDLTASPADTVKKRRRTASWKIGVNGPTIVSVPDDVEDKTSKKKHRRNPPVNDTVHSENGVPEVDYPDTLQLTGSDDLSLEELVASWKDGITGIGQDFKNVYEFRDALQKFAIANRFVYRLKKNDSNRASGRCVTEGCSWRIHASWVAASQSFKIKKFNNTHTCGGESWKHAHPTKNWLVNIIKERLRDSPHHKPKDIANCILKDFGIELNYTQVWRGIEDAREQLQGPYKEAYNQLPMYSEKIKETNPGSFTALVLDDDRRFQRLFISFHASIQGFQKGCRPLVFLEASSFKSKYQEILLTATALDGNDGFFPLAFSVVDNENNDSWHWFLEQLKSVLPTSEPLTFVYDREKGLKESILNIFDGAHIGYSMYHLVESFKKSWKGPFHGDGKSSLLGNFLAASHAARLIAFKRFTEHIKLVSSQAYDWVMEIEPECWTTTSCKGVRHNHITQNAGESYSKVLEEVRESPIIQKLEALRVFVTNLVDSRRTDSSTWSAWLTPSKMEKLHEEIVDARGLKALFSSETLFEVHDDVNHVVNLNNRDCTCLRWQTTDLPCRHAIAVFNRIGKNVYDYCSNYFKAESFKSTYSESISPVPLNVCQPGENEAATSDTAQVLPPCPAVKIQSGEKQGQTSEDGETKNEEDENEAPKSQRKRRGRPKSAEADHDKPARKPRKRSAKVTELDENRSEKPAPETAPKRQTRRRSKTTEVEEAANDGASEKQVQEPAKSSEVHEAISENAKDDEASKEQDKTLAQATEVNDITTGEAKDDETSMEKGQSADVDQVKSKEVAQPVEVSTNQGQTSDVVNDITTGEAKDDETLMEQGQSADVDQVKSKEVAQPFEVSTEQGQTSDVVEVRGEESEEDRASKKTREALAQTIELNEAGCGERDETSDKQEEAREVEVAVGKGDDLDNIVSKIATGVQSQTIEAVGEEEDGENDLMKQGNASKAGGETDTLVGATDAEVSGKSDS